MNDDATWAAVSLHQMATEKAPPTERFCANCGQKITRWTLPQPGHPEDEDEAWYHLCVDPVGLKHLYLHSDNDHADEPKSKMGFSVSTCPRAEPTQSEWSKAMIKWFHDEGEHPNKLGIEL